MPIIMTFSRQMRRPAIENPSISEKQNYRCYISVQAAAIVLPGAPEAQRVYSAARQAGLLRVRA